MSERRAVPDLLLRIAERRRERLEEARGRDAAGAAPAAIGAAAAWTQAAATAATGANAAAAAAAHAARAGGDGGDGGDHDVPTVPDGEPELAGPRDNPFLAALTHPSRARGARLPTPGAAVPTEGSVPPAAPPVPAIIAEVKMGSPRLGSLQGRVDPIAQARLYAANGAAALSVVVEPDFFFGSYELLEDCRAASGLPVLAKDFVVDPLQLAWARSAGADAVLLIAALYEPEELARYARLARGLGLVPLIETHDTGDLACLAGEPWELVGVNNRDLRTFEVDLERSIAMLPSLPAQALEVAESGIRDALDVALLIDSGFDALLVGETLLLADDPAAKLRALLGGGEATES